jgi:elongation factor P--(R)-beta-lysine ligase
MDWQPTASVDALRMRARLNAVVRDFFAQRGVLEVETPLMSRAGNTDPNIASFALEFSGRTDGASRTRWLRTSAEFPMKRLLAAGIGDCYELGRVFRDGEAGGRHNPEFTMLEWYRVGWDHLRLVDETVALVQSALALVQREASVARIAFRDLYRDTLGLDPMTAEVETLRAAFDGDIDPTGLTRDDWLDLLMTHRIQPRFPPNQLLAVHDYPASQCALARVVQRDDVRVAERFELYLGSLELANGYHELTDAQEQRGRFARDLDVRNARGAAAAPPMDEGLLAAIQAGLPSCAGVALGVDRLLMAMLGTDRIADVLAFDFGALLDGYCSDFGRTVFIGEPTDERRAVYDLVIAAQGAAIEAMKDGQIAAEELDRVARSMIAVRSLRFLRAFPPNGQVSARVTLFVRWMGHRWNQSPRSVA